MANELKFIKYGQGELVITLNKVGNPTPAANIQYRKNFIDGHSEGGVYQFGTTITAAGISSVTFFGTGSTLSQDTENYYQFKITTPVTCEGDVASLINNSTTASPYCFVNLFKGCTGLIMPPNLSTIGTLAKGCYYQMFQGCTNLRVPPHLPATEMAYACYYMMFEGCTSLVTTPAMAINSVAGCCCQCMFQGCSSLYITATAFPAGEDVALAQNCFYGMFFGCTSLQTPPALPATTLADGCYYQMFQGCRQLSSAPQLPASTLVANCYTRMFYDCTKLNSISVHFTEWLDGATDNWLYGVARKGTFEKSPALKKIHDESHIPNLWKKVNTLNPLILEVEDPKGEPDESVTAVCNFKLKKCGNPKSIQLEYRKDNVSAWEPLKINRTYTLKKGEKFQIRGYNDTFSTDRNVDFYRFETEDVDLTSEQVQGTLKVSGDLLSLITSNDLTDNNQFARLFEGSKVSNIDDLNFPSANLTNYCFYRMFADCEELELIGNEQDDAANKKIIENLLPADVLAPGCYASMFQGCCYLRNMPELPATTLAKNCYKKMFKGCEDLDVVPELMADVLEPDCYQEMFYDCSKINSIKCNFDDWNDYHATDLWLTNTKDCTIFLQDEKLEQKYSVNNIPENGYVIKEKYADLKYVKVLIKKAKEFEYAIDDDALQTYIEKFKNWEIKDLQNITKDLWDNTLA